jgi:hypothetical protein
MSLEGMATLLVKSTVHQVLRRVVPLAAALVLAAGPVGSESRPAPPSSVQTSSAPASRGAVGQQLLQLPLHLEPAADDAGFVSRGPGYALRVDATATHFLLRGESPASVRVEIRGGNKKAVGRAVDALPGRSNYFLGNDPSRWRRDVPHYGRVEYRGVYPGIDVAYYGREGQLEYDFIVGAGADPRRIVMRFEGAKRLRIDADGNLVVSVPGGGELTHRAPVAYQEGDRGRSEVQARFVKRGSRDVGFAVGAYDRGRALVIDPVLVYSTYLGGSHSDYLEALAVDGAGNVYVAGFTYSTDFPTANPLQASLHGHPDAFVTKLDAAGSALVYSTYLGGSGIDRPNALAVDAAGNAYVAGVTSSADFPTANPIQASLKGGADAFVVTLNAAGSALVYSTYLGGGNLSDADSAEALAVDGAGNAYVAGRTFSTDYPTANPLQASLHGPHDAFVTKLDAAGTALVYSTYLGGSDIEFA